MPVSSTLTSINVLTLKIPEDLDRDLERVAQERGVSKSHLAREAISRLVTVPNAAGKGFVSALELAGDLVGSIDRSPRGLSTNPKHLEGFGKT